MPVRLYAFLNPPVCKKCLSGAIQTAYCPEILCSGYAIGRDHLHRTCETCGYTWFEECLRWAYRLISTSAAAANPLSPVSAARPEATPAIERPDISEDLDTVAPTPRHRQGSGSRPTPDAEFLQMKDRLAYLLREVVPFEGTTRELVARLLDEFPKLAWLRDPRRVGPFAKALEAQRATLSAAGIDLSIERSGEGPNRIRMTAVPEGNGAPVASAEA